MKKETLKSELDRRLGVKDGKKACSIYVHEDTWTRFMEWCAAQTPPRKASPVIEGLIEMLMESEPVTPNAPKKGAKRKRSD